MFIAACFGKGGSPLSGEAKWPGFIGGGKILWVSIDNPQMEMIWKEEIVARFDRDDLKGIFHVDKVNRTVTFLENGGKLFLRSMERPKSIRGQKYDGVVGDEAAFYNFMTIFNAVIRPTLVDRKGFAIVSSTPHVGSEFNLLCERIQAGEMGPSWEESYKTAWDNPLLDKEELDEWAAGYHEDDLELQEEVYARLAVAGGLAFPEFDPRVHVRAFEPPDYWEAVGGLDWGYASEGWFGLAFLGPDRQVFLRWELYFNGRATAKMTPYQLGVRIGQNLIARRFQIPSIIWADAAMNASPDGSASMMERFHMGLVEALGEMSPGVAPAPKGPQSRITRKAMLHEGLRWRPEHGPPDERKYDPPEYLAPRLRIHPECNHLIRTIPRLPRDEREPEKVETKGVEDHPYDGLTYILVARTPFVEVPREWEDDVPVNVHPGLSATGRRKRPRWMDQFEDSDEISNRFVRN